MISIVLDRADGGSRDLVRAADSVARYRAGAEILLATAGELPILPSLVERLGVRIHPAQTRAAAINAAVAAASHDILILVTVPWLAGAATIAACRHVVSSFTHPSVVVAGLELRTADGLTRRRLNGHPHLTSLLAHPLAVPPVFALNRSTWSIAGPLDERLRDLAGCEWWLRVLARGWSIVHAAAAPAVLEAGERSWWPPIVGALDFAAYRSVLEKHRSLLESQMSDLVVRLEMASGTLLRDHRAQLAMRDRDLAELDRVRTEAAHHRAYVDHHADFSLDWGDLRRSDPISRDWGYDRGTPVDRRYIDDFLAARSSDVRGAVLEVQEDDFTRRFGGPRVTHRDVVDLDDSNPRATIVADLRAAVGLPDEAFDCIILTQTLHVIDDATAVLRECFRLLKPGGVLLATLPSASRVCLEYGEDGDLWRITPAGATALFDPVFGARNVEVATYGNVLTNVAFLHGLACSEVADEEFEAHDPYHPLVVGVRAQKATRATKRWPRYDTGVVLLYHRVADRDDVHGLSVPSEVFEEQMQWLARECRVLPLDELLSGARHGLPERAVAITFDDGYLDTLNTAVPLLERLGLPATVFATTECLESPGEYWWDVLERALLLSETPPLLTLRSNGEPVTFDTDTLDRRRTVHDHLHNLLVHATRVDRDRVVSDVVRWSGTTPDHSCRPLVADELRQLAATPGMCVGAHTVHHLALPDQDARTQRSEVLDSLRTLERVTGRRVDVFAHPYGAFDRKTTDLVRESCRWSAGCQPAAIASSFDAAAFPRLEVKRWDATILRHRLSECGFSL